MSVISQPSAEKARELLNRVMESFKEVQAQREILRRNVKINTNSDDEERDAKQVPDVNCPLCNRKIDYGDYIACLPCCALPCHIQCIGTFMDSHGSKMICPSCKEDSDEEFCSTAQLIRSLLPKD